MGFVYFTEIDNKENVFKINGGQKILKINTFRRNHS